MALLVRTTVSLIVIVASWMNFTYAVLSEELKFTEHTRFEDAGIPVTTLFRNVHSNKLICGYENGEIAFRDLSDGKELRRFKAHGNAVKTIGLNSNGRLMISSTSDGEIKIFDFDKNEYIQGIFSPDYSNMNFVLFSIADGFIYFNSGRRMYKTRSDLTQKVNLVMEDAEVLNAAIITPDRNSLIFAAGNKLKVLNTRSDIIRQEVNTGNSSVKYLHLIGDSLLVSWNEEGSIAFWKYKLGQLDFTPYHWFRAGNPAPMNFSPDGKILVSGLIGNWARVWRPFEKKVQQEIFGHTGPVTCSSFGPDSRTLFTAGKDGRLIKWISLPEDEIPKDAPDKITKATESISKPEVEISSNNDTTVRLNLENIPEFIQGRKVQSSENIILNTPEIIVYIFDNSYVDGDTMSLFFNGSWLLKNYGVTKKKKEIKLTLKEDTNNFLVLFANNLGRNPPNTAAIQFNDGKRDRILRLSSDLSSCNALNFIYKKAP
ncbi:MAG: hypothetical protein DWQ33_07555 [Bacteroidetes bacterium]|nr:MAG: hypothetical protein DWQ33_07555 [Bacteroidota bacterium]